jgi:hypothetical protein
VYVGFAETSLAGLPGIEDYRSIALSGKSGKVCCNESDLPLFGATAALDTALCNAQAAPFEEVEPMRFAAGDVVGCGIDLRVHRAFFTKNGDFGGWAGDLRGERGESWGPTGPDGQWILPPDDNIKMFPVVAFKNKEDVISINIAAEGFPLRPLAFNTDELPPLPSEPPTPAHTSRPGGLVRRDDAAAADGPQHRYPHRRPRAGRRRHARACARPGNPGKRAGRRRDAHVYKHLVFRSAHLLVF